LRVIAESPHVPSATSVTLIPTSAADGNGVLKSPVTPARAIPTRLLMAICGNFRKTKKENMTPWKWDARFMVYQRPSQALVATFQIYLSSPIFHVGHYTRRRQINRTLIRLPPVGCLGAGQWRKVPKVSLYEQERFPIFHP